MNCIMLHSHLNSTQKKCINLNTEKCINIIIILSFMFSSQHNTEICNTKNNEPTLHSHFILAQKHIIRYVLLFSNSLVSRSRHRHNQWIFIHRSNDFGRLGTTKVMHQGNASVAYQCHKLNGNDNAINSKEK